MENSVKSKSYKQFCFTFNNPPPSPFTPNPTYADFMIYSLEKAPATGTYHLQGYVRTDRKYTKADMVSLMPGCHVTVCRGSERQNIDYCSKSPVQGPWTFGLPMKDSNNSIIGLREALKRGDSDLQIFEDDDILLPMLKYLKGADRMREAYTEPIAPCLDEVILLYGPTGTGKSYWAEKYKPEYTTWTFPVGSKYFAGYFTQEKVIINEMHGGVLQFNQALNVFDKYPIKVPIYYGQVDFRPRSIILTSNCLPEEWYPNSTPIDALTRRITRYIYKPKIDEEYEFSKYCDLKRFISTYVQNQ